VSTILARCIGLDGRPQISKDKAILYLHRKGKIRRCEAQVAVLDYFGIQREEMSELLGIAVQTVDKYWTRLYATTGRQGREAVRAWVEEMLAQAIAEDSAGATP
jgi:DNA-binding CsgD family transcriptional regulator